MSAITLPTYQKNMVSCFRMANKIGMIPILGSAVGVIRTTGALLITFFALTILAGKRIVTGKTGDTIPHLIKLSTAHLVLGILEIIPLLGTVVHKTVDKRVEGDGGSSKYIPNVCREHPEFEHFLHLTLTRSPIKDEVL